MKKWIRFIFFNIVFLCLFKGSAYANIAPLKVNADGVEPLKDPGVKIDSAAITVTPNEDGYKFICLYNLTGLSDMDALTLGIPGDLGYTLEAGYIDNINIFVNSSEVEYQVYDTTQNLPDTWKEYGSSLHYKWHAFTLPVKKDEKINLYITYNMYWKAIDQSRNSPYHIIPFILSTDKLFGSIGSYKIKYINSEYISLPDVKVMINSALEPNITSPAILSPKWNDTQIMWELKDSKDFQDFRLIVLSYKKLAMGFTTGTLSDNTIQWAVLNNNNQRLAEIFESIAKGEADVSTEDRGTAAYLSSEFYFRVHNYDKALEMLSSSYRTIIWPSSLKENYVNAVKYKEQKEYNLLIKELKTLDNYKDYVLLSNFSQNEIIPAVNTLAVQAAEDAPLEYLEAKKEYPKLPYIIAGAAALLVLAAGLSFTVYKHKKRKAQ